MTKKRLIDFRSTNNSTRKSWKGKVQKDVKPSRRLLLFLSSSAAVGLLVGIALLSIYKWLSVSDFFQITSIKIEGARRLDKQQVRALSGLTIQTNLLGMNGEEVVKKIEAHDWIKKATVKRDLPSDLIITIQERQPVALLNRPDGLYYIDKRGEVFAAANPPEDLDYPVITGLEAKADMQPNDGTPGGKLENEVLRKALLFVKHAGRGSSSLPRQNISEIYVSEKQEYVLFLADRPFPIYLGLDVSRKRYYRLAKVLYWLYKKREFSDVNFIRMDYMNDKVLVSKNEAS